MADLFTVTAPLAIRFKDGSKQIMIRTFKHKDGLLFLAPFWHELSEDKQFQLITGPIKGEGPWKIGSAVVTVLGCHGTDTELASQFADWQSYLVQNNAEYPNDEMIKSMAANHSK
ncbi:MAG: hypothetical protein V3V18_09795 [Methylococcales bacterium]